MGEGDEAGGLQIDDDIRYHRRAWTVQRIGWGLMALVVLAAAAGLLGPGPLSGARADADGGLMRVQYQRFLHYQSPTTLAVELAPAAAREGQVRLWLARDYAEAGGVQAVIPPPARVEADSERLTYIFPAAPAGGPAAVTFHLQPERVGPLEARLGLPDGQALSVGQFVYP
jgi:hypothetical protein